ncbi:MAG: glycosyltransferase [Chromatiales bacterium]|nr:glycosyltransferase [Chromatiales bacterium]
MIANLATGILALGHPVDIVAARTQGAHVEALPAGARLIRLAARHSTTALPALVRYLRNEPPSVLLAAKERAIRTAVLAKRLSGSQVPLYGRMGTTLSAALEGGNPLSRSIRYALLRNAYRRLDGLIAVSGGVADDVEKIAGMERTRIHVIRNPVIGPWLAKAAEADPQHPWFGDGGDPIVLGAGRLTRQKDFPTLLRAFALANRHRGCRLIILGEGRDRQALLDLANELGVADRVDLPGFRANPHALMARADVFVLSSLWEGSPNVLTEAMALGAPVVSTDCPSGPREVLDGGRLAPLVPMSDPDALAKAIVHSLEQPPQRAMLQEAVRDYHMDVAARHYLTVMGLAPTEAE